MGSAAGNVTLVCQNPHSFGHKDIWHQGSPIDSPTCLLFLQVSLITFLSHFMHILLKPLGQSSLVSQILSGFVLGPSVLKEAMEDVLFPVKSKVMLDTISAFGLVFFYFIWCVKMDIGTLLRTEKVAITFGLCTFLFTMSIPTGVSFLMRKYLRMDNNLFQALPYVALSEGLTVFISIAVLLTDLKLLNTDIGRLSMSAAMFSDIIGFILMVFMFSVMQNVSGDMMTLVWILACTLSLFLAIIFVMRPVILWIFKRSGDGSLSELCLACIFFFVMLTSLLSELVGQHYVMGPVILGLAVPEGPPLGTALITKLETMCLAFLYPLFLAVSGLQTDIFKINKESLWILSIIVIVSFTVKICAVMLAGYFCNVSMKECILIGLILNGRGIAELSMYSIWMGNKLLSQQEFSLMVLSVVIINIIVSPLIKYTYDPLEQYNTGRRCTIQHNTRDAELRVMVCIYKNENIPTILNLLEASYASRESMVVVIALILVELLGRVRPILVAHQPHENLRSISINSHHLDNALEQYAQHNAGFASVQSFTSISNFDTIFNDVCRISLERKANILILPFHKRWEIDGTVEVTNRSIQTMNIKVLERAPCSVGILVDRGTLNASPSLLIGRSTFYVAVFFLGGADDSEALAYSARMARHECVNVTVVRFLLFGEENSKERKRDSDLLDEYRYYNAGNRRFVILEEVVKDGIEMSTCIRKMIDYFDLVMVGKDHTESVMLQGHDQWSECPELGVIGDMLASADFLTKASVLVVQHQRIRGRLVNHNMNPVPNQRDQLVHDVPIDQISNASCTISVDKCSKT